MPRNGSGTFTLVSGNPVVTGTTIESNWANTTLSDIATAMTDSLSRSGQGGMTAALRVADGTQGAPGVGFANETGSGLYRAGTAEVWAVVQGAQTMKIDSTGVTVPAAKATSIEGSFVFNETGADKDARFEGDTDANLLFTDASTDRVGVGTATPAAKLDVNGTAAISGNVTLSGGTANGVLYLNGSKVATSGTALAFNGTSLLVGKNSSDANNWGVQNYATNAFGSGMQLTYGGVGSAGVWVPAASSLAFGADAGSGTTELMRITSTGLGIGLINPAYRLDVEISSGPYNARFRNSSTSTSEYNTTLWGQGASGSATGYVGTGGSTVANAAFQNTFVVGTQTSNALVFNTADTERARITSGGDLLVGTTTVGAGLTDGFSLQMGGGASQIHIGHTSGIGSGELYAGFSRGGTTIGSISQNGTTAVLFNTTSDRRLKENIAPAPSASDVIDAIEIVSHDWKSAPDEHVTYGVIAQDLALVAPQAVLQGDDGDEIEKAWGVDYSKLVPMLIKEIQSLRARVAALEAQP